jgi:chromosome segregation ATPase
MGLRETLQAALVSANNERIKWHDQVQDYDNELVDSKAALRRVEEENAGADRLHKDAVEKHQELLKHRNQLPDEAGRRALDAEIAKLAGNVNFTVEALGIARERVRQRQNEVQALESKRASAQKSEQVASERWEQIRKQLADLKY